MIRDDYAGPGGWSEGLRALGIHDVGIEWDRWACATRAAAGHLTIRADLATYRTPAEPIVGYLASPPCQTFSSAGKGEGRAQLDDLLDIIARRAWAEADQLDTRTRHVIDTARNCAYLAPRWICLEQVPAVLPLWQQVARMLDARGYSAWTGVLNAADYGVPQTRRRAVLIASIDRPVSCPAPTHAKEPAATLFGPALAPWVTMVEALGWGFVEPSATVSGGGASTGGPEPFANADYRKRLAATVLENRRDSHAWIEAEGERRNRPADEPAPTMAGEAHRWRWSLDRRQSHGGVHPLNEVGPTVTSRADLWTYSVDRRQVGAPVIDPHANPSPTLTAQAEAKGIWKVERTNGEEVERVRLTVAEALVLQSFPAGYPVQGPRSAQFLQVGNAIPPRLAMHVAAEALGMDLAALEAAS